jgi:hypothetical protein
MSQEFYAGLFPAWNFLPASEQYKEENICMISFEQPSGK